VGERVVPKRNRTRAPDLIAALLRALVAGNVVVYG